MKGFKIFTGNAHPEFSKELAHNLDCTLSKATITRFSDGEINVQISESVRGKDVFIVQPTCAPTNDNLMELLIMPETFILFRFFFEHLGYTQKWRELMNQLSFQEREELYPIIFKNNFNHIEDLTTNPKFLHILQYYRDYRKDIADPKSELFRLKVEFDAQQINI